MTDSTTILHGYSDFRITLPKETPRRGTLDTVEQTFQTSRRKVWEVDDGRNGRISRFPGYQNVFIDEIVRDEEIPGRAYEQRLKGLGLLDGRDKIISKRVSNPEEGFDTGEIELLTLRPERWKQKEPHPEIPTMYITDRDAEIEIGTISRVRASYKGILPVDGAPKGYKRRLGSSSSTQETSGTVTIYHYAPGTGWVAEAPAKRYRFDASRIQVTDSYLSTTPPQYDLLPSNWQPPGAPTTVNSATGLALITAGGTGSIDGSLASDVLYNRPWGWVLRSYSVEQLFNLPVWFYTLTAEWVPEVEIKL